MPWLIISLIKVFKMISARFMEHEMAIYDSKKDERLEMLKKKIASGLLSCFFSVGGFIARIQIITCVYSW